MTKINIITKTIVIIIIQILFNNCQINNALKTENKTNNLNYLKNTNKQYPYDIKLFENSIFTERLKKLIGTKNYKYLIKTWAVEIPIKCNENTFVAFACEAHNCGVTDFIIIIDFLNDKLYVKIRKNKKVKIYSEDNNIPYEIKSLISAD